MTKKIFTDVFFDLDHTLWDFDKNSELAFAKIFQENHPSIAISDFISVYAPINQACWKLYQFDKISHEELRYKRLKDSFDAINYSISDTELHQMAIDYITFLPENNLLFEGAKEILDYLKPKYRLHIITNGFAEVQFKKLKNSGIAAYFSSVTNSEMAGVKKPHPDIFKYALSLTNAAKENCVMIGDCLEADVEGALNFGMEAIHFNDQNLAVSKHRQITHLSELKNYL